MVTATQEIKAAGTRDEQVKPGVSKLKLAVGAASLFLFIVGIKRSYWMEDAHSEHEGGRPEPEERSRDAA